MTWLEDWVRDMAQLDMECFAEVRRVGDARLGYFVQAFDGYEERDTFRIPAVVWDDGLIFAAGWDEQVDMADDEDVRAYGHNPGWHDQEGMLGVVWPEDGLPRKML
jgi:hypothetical protein